MVRPKAEAARDDVIVGWVWLDWQFGLCVLENRCTLKVHFEKTARRAFLFFGKVYVHLHS